MTQGISEPYNCTDACGNKAVNPEALGWTRLEITNRWRCPACTRALREINEACDARAKEMGEQP